MTTLAQSFQVAGQLFSTADKTADELRRATNCRWLLRCTFRPIRDSERAVLISRHCWPHRGFGSAVDSTGWLANRRTNEPRPCRWRYCWSHSGLCSISWVGFLPVACPSDQKASFCLPVRCRPCCCCIPFFLLP